jgi:hypothetical protein
MKTVSSYVTNQYCPSSLTVRLRSCICKRLSDGRPNRSSSSSRSTGARTAGAGAVVDDSGGPPGQVINTIGGTHMPLFGHSKWVRRYVGYG